MLTGWTSFSGALGSRLLNVLFASQTQYAVTVLTARASNRWKADHSLRDRRGRTCLHCAVSSGNTDSIVQLLKAGCLVNALDNAGHSVLHLARSVEAIDLLVRHDAEIDHASHHGPTLLQYAIYNSRPRDVIKCFIRHGASIHAVSDWGNDAFAIAIIYNHCEALEVLIDAEKSCVRLNPYKCR